MRTLLASETQRYGLMPLFCCAVFFLVLAPLFWLHAVKPAAEGYAVAGAVRDGAWANAWTLPALAYTAQRHAAGELPLWNPRAACGEPHAANPAAAAYDPLGLLFSFFPMEKALALHAFLCLSMMGFFFTLFARSYPIPHTAAMLGGAIYAFGGASTAVTLCPGALSALAWLPLLFWAMREFNREARWPWAGLAGLLGALILVSGTPAVVLPAVLLAVGYGVTRVAAARTDPGLPDREALTLGYLIALGMGVALAAVQWIPALAWLIARAQPYDALLVSPLAGRAPAGLGAWCTQALQLGRDGDMPGRVAYLGAASLALAAAAAFHKGHRVERVYFLCCAAVSVALGASLGLSGLFSVALFCCALLSALGAGCLFNPKGERMSPRVWGPLLLALGMGGATFYLAGAVARGPLALAAVCVAIPFVFRRVWAAAFPAIALAVLVYFDLYAAATGQAAAVLSGPAWLREHATAFAAVTEQAAGGRVIALGPGMEGFANAGMRAGLPGADTVTPLDGAQAQWRAALLEGIAARPDDPGKALAARRLLDLMAVRAVLAPADTALFPKEGAGPPLRLARRYGPLGVYVNDTALPRAYWSPGWSVVPNISEAFGMLRKPEFDTAKVCLIQPSARGYQALVTNAPEAGLSANPATSVGGPGASAIPAAEESGESARPGALCSIEEDLPEQVSLRVNAPRAGVVVLADSFAPGWRATCDGAAVEVLRVNGLFRGVPVSAGAHKIVFTYRPLSIYAGLGVAAAALLILAGGLIAAPFYARKRE